MPIFRDLPEAVLAALIIHAVSHLMRVGELRGYLRLAPQEFWLALLTLAGVVILNLLPALVLGVVVSLVLVIGRASRPKVSVLGRDPDAPGGYGDVDRHPGLLQVDGVLIMRPEAPLFYANAQAVRDAIDAAADATEPRPRVVILDLDANDELDLTSLEHLAKLDDELAARGIHLSIAHLHEPAQRLAGETGLLGRLNGRVFPNLPSAVEAAQGVADSPARPAGVSGSHLGPNRRA